MKDFKIDKGIYDLENKIGLQKGFFQKLINEDDWSFIIKLHALIEAVTTHLLLDFFEEPNLIKIISRLEMSEKTIGKIAFLKALNLVDNEYQKFITELSELRNNLVHDVKNCNITLNDYINTLDKNQIKKFATSFSPFETILQSMDENNIIKKDDENFKNLKKEIDINNMIERAKNHPKLHIWLSAYNFLISVYDNISKNEYIKFEKAKKIIYEQD